MQVHVTSSTVWNPNHYPEILQELRISANHGKIQGKATIDLMSTVLRQQIQDNLGEESISGGLVPIQLVAT